jgi:hypothetical protein
MLGVERWALGVSFQFSAFNFPLSSLSACVAAVSVAQFSFVERGWQPSGEGWLRG